MSLTPLTCGKSKKKKYFDTNKYKYEINITVKKS